MVRMKTTGQELIMIDLHNKGDLVGVFAAHHTQHAVSRGNAVASAFDGQFDDILRIEIDGVGREG